MKTATRCGSTSFLTWIVCGAVGGARADSVVVSPSDEAAAGFFDFQTPPITYPDGGPFLTAAILADRYVESAVLFDLQAFRSLGATITQAELTVYAIGYDSEGPSGPTLFVEWTA